MTDRKVRHEILNLAMSDVSNWTVLIVDDEPDNLAVAKKVLTYGGATVHTAKNGVEGLKVLQEVKPLDVLILSKL